MLDDNLAIIVGEFNHASILQLIVFDLNDLPISATRGNYTLDRLITSRPNLLRHKLGAPLLASDHCLLLLKPEVYCWMASRSFKESSQIKLLIGDLL